jgi:uncharacterized protein YdhG (YjbR/CyaY superfamily)
MTGEEVFNNYLKKQDAHFAPCLTDLRRLILSVVPQATETFSYQAHCFKYLYMLAGIGVTSDSCSLYTMSPSLVKNMKAELEEYKPSGGTIHFQPDETLPEALIIKEVEALALARKKR